MTDEALTADVTVEEEAASELEVTTTQADVVADQESVEVYLNVLNQYGTEYTGADFNNLTVNVFEQIEGVSFGSVTEAASTDDKGNLKGTFTVTDTDGDDLKAGDTFKVTAVYEGLTASSEVSFVDSAGISELSFGQVAPLEDETRISVNDSDLVVPNDAVDQYDSAYELDLTEDITWVSSNPSIVMLNRITDKICEYLDWEGDLHITPHGFRASICDHSG